MTIGKHDKMTRRMLFFGGLGVYCTIVIGGWTVIFTVSLRKRLESTPCVVFMLIIIQLILKLHFKLCE